MTPNRIFIKDQSAIPLGMQGDGNVREIVFSPPDELAGKTWTASHQRATDPDPYPVALRADEDKLIWLVSAADTDVAGQGRFQLVCLDGDDQVLKTMVYRTHVSASLSTPGDVPDPVKPWYDALMRELADIGDIPPEEIEQAVRDYLTEHPIAETDPTVPDWAKQPEKPTYTAEDVGALAQDALQDAIDQALAQAKNSGEFDGEKGSPGKDGITPHIGGNGNWYLGDNDTGKPSRGDPGTPGKNGVDGTSVTVQTVAESTEDGGENVVTFSDGKTLTVKNGKEGANGADGHTPIRGTDYYTEADKREIVDDVLEQMTSGGGDVTLGIAGAMVGQIAKITAVDADGKPTAWEPVDMAGEKAWEQVIDVTLGAGETVNSLVIEAYASANELIAECESYGKNGDEPISSGSTMRVNWTDTISGYNPLANNVDNSFGGTTSSRLFTLYAKRVVQTIWTAAAAGATAQRFSVAALSGYPLQGLPKFLLGSPSGYQFIEGTTLKVWVR